MVTIPPFALERFFARHEFSARYLLSCSDCEPLTLTELLASADADSLRLWEGLTLGYTESPGHPVLREAVAGIYDGLGRDDILVAVPEEAIFLTVQALVGPGDHVVCTFPGYQSLYEVARSLGCEVSLWEPDEERGWEFNPARLDRLMRENTRLLVVNFPHNPTGALPAREVFADLVARVRATGAYLLSDEMYRFLEVDADAVLPAACEIYERAVTLGGLSKSFGLPGLRIGWLATRDREVIERVARLKDYTTICNSAPSEILALMALRTRSRIVAAQCERLHRNRRVLNAFLTRHADRFGCIPPQGGSICFPRLLAQPDSHAFCEDLLAASGIMLVPSRLFAYGDHHVRIGFGRDDLPEVLERFADYLRHTG